LRSDTTTPGAGSSNVVATRRTRVENVVDVLLPDLRNAARRS
jgi:hypothetical protein